MTIRDFCVENGYKISTVSDRIRTEVLNRVLEGSSEELSAANVEERVPDLGMEVRSPKGNRRFSYEVTNPGALRQWVGEELGTDAITDRELDDLVDYCKWLSDLIHGRSDWYKIEATGASGLQQDDLTEHEWTERLDEILAKLGRIEQHAE